MRYYLGIDLGGTNIVAGVADEHYQMLEKVSVATQPTRGFAAVTAAMAGAARQALKAAGLGPGDVDYVGIGVPSTVNPENHHVYHANNLGWKDADLITEFQKSWDIPVHVANDADCAALGESVAGAAKNYKSCLLITLGTGVGGGLVMDDRLWLGGTGTGVEPGHSVLVYNGFPCTCGRRGCLESYVSVTALIRQTIAYMTVNRSSLMWAECGNDLNRVNGRTAFEAAKKGDAAGQQVVDAYIGYLGDGLASLVTAYRPHAVLIGGGISNEGEYLLKPLRQTVAATMYGHDVMDPPAVLKAALGNDAGVIGAAVLGVCS